MVKKYRKSEVFEALRLTQESWAERKELAMFGDVPNKSLLVQGGSEPRMKIFVFRGMVDVKLGDWILRDSRGRLTVCRSDEFKKRYLPVD